MYEGMLKERTKGPNVVFKGTSERSLPTEDQVQSSI